MRADVDRALAYNARTAGQNAAPEVPAKPRRRVAVVACMDARINVERLLGFRRGDAHVIRNAGGVVTDDVLRSLVVSQHLLGTEEVIVIEHTGCGMLGLDEDAVRDDLRRATGVHAEIEFLAFSELEANIRSQLARLRAHPWVRPTAVSGLILEIDSGRLRRAG